MSTLSAAVEKSDVLRDSGLLFRVRNQEPVNDPDGSEVEFRTVRGRLFDADRDDDVDTFDVVVYVDNTPVGVSSVVADSGMITLNTAPPTGSTITIDYWYSNIDDYNVDLAISRAIDSLNSRVPCEDISATADAGHINAVILYASGLILIRDYGSHSDTNESSKDGYRKLEEAKELIDSYSELKCGTSSSTGGSSGSSSSNFTGPYGESSNSGEINMFGEVDNPINEHLDLDGYRDERIV